MSDQTQPITAINTYNMIHCSNLVDNKLLAASTTRQKGPSSSFFSLLPSPILTYKTRKNCLICLLLNGEIYRIFRDDSGRIEIELSLHLPLSKDLLTAGCFIPESKGSIIICSVSQFSTDSSRFQAAFDSQVSIYSRQKRQHLITFPGIVIRECIPTSNLIVFLGHCGEIFFYSYVKESLSLVSKFSSPHEFAVELITNCGKAFKQRSFTMVCRLLMLNVATIPLTFASSSCLFLLYQNGSLIALSGFSVILYALLQPHQSGNALSSSTLYINKTATRSKTQPIIKPVALSVASGYIFVGFTNSVLSIYCLDQIKNDMSQGILSTQPIKSISILDLYKYTASTSGAIRTDDKKRLNKGISALHPVYLWDTTNYQSRPESHQDEEDHASIYLTEVSSHVASPTTRDAPGPFSHINLCLLLSINNSTDVFLLKLFPQHELKLILTYEGSSQLQMAVVSVTRILFLTDNGFTQTIYAQFSNGALFRLILPTHLFFYSALKPPPPKQSPTVGIQEIQGINDDNDTDNDNSASFVQDATDKSLTTTMIPSRHPLISSTKNIKEMAIDSPALIEDMFPYGRYYSASGKDIDKHYSVDSLIAKKQCVSPLNVLLNDNSEIPYTMHNSHLGQVARSLPLSHTGRSGPCFTNLLVHKSPLITQTIEINRCVAESLERHADIKMSKAIPNEKIYHQVILTPSAPIRSRFVLNFLPTGNPIFRLLDGTVSKPKPIITQFNAMLESSDIYQQAVTNKLDNTNTVLRSKHIQSSTNNSLHLRPSSPTQLRRSHLLRIELPMPLAAREHVKMQKHHASTYSSLIARKSINTSQIGDMLTVYSNLDTGGSLLPIAHKTRNPMNELFPDLQPRDLDTESIDINRCYTPFGPIESLSVYRHSDFCKKNGDLRLIYPHRKFTQESEGSFNYNLSFSFQSESIEQESFNNSQLKSNWAGSMYYKRRHRTVPVQSLMDSHHYSSALSISPVKLYNYDTNLRKRWLSKRFNARRHGNYEVSASQPDHQRKRQSTDNISFFVINLNDLFVNPVARQILRINVSSKNTSNHQPPLHTLLSDLPKKIGIEDTNRDLDKQMGYEISYRNEGEQHNLEQDRKLLTTKLETRDTTANMKSPNATEGISKPQQPTSLSTNPTIDFALKTDQLELLDIGSVNDPIESLDSVPTLKNLPPAKSPISNADEQKLQAGPSKYSGVVPDSSQSHDPCFLIDESGNLVMFTTPITPILSDIIKDGTLKPIIDDMENLSRDSIDDTSSFKIPATLRCNLYDSQANEDLGISLDFFPHNKMRISHNKYDLLSICTYRGPLPKLDDETKHFLEVMEQRSRYHLDCDDKGASFMFIEPSIRQTTLENIDVYRQTISIMSAQLNQINYEKDRVQQLYREIIRRILKNIDRLCEQDCIKKVTLGKDKYYSLKRQCVVDYSSSSTDSLLEKETSKINTPFVDTDNSEKLSNAKLESQQYKQHKLPIYLEENQLSQNVESSEEIVTSDSSDLMLSELNANVIGEHILDKEGNANDSFLAGTAPINEPSISNIDAKSSYSPSRIDLIENHSTNYLNDSIDDFFEDSLKENSTSTIEVSKSSSSALDENVFEKDKYIGQDSPQRYVIHRDKRKILFDIYAEDQEYSDTDPIYTEDNPKYVPIALTNEQYEVLFHIDAHFSKRLRHINMLDLLSLYMNTLDYHVEPQLWFMKTGYQFFPLQEDNNWVDNGQQSNGLRNALSFQQVRTHLTLGDTAEHHSHEEMVSILTTALPDGENSEEARIIEETPDDLNSDIFEDDINNIAYNDMTIEQKQKYLLNERYVDGTNLYLGKTLDELGYFMLKRKKERQQRHGSTDVSIFDLMTSGLGFAKPRMPDSYITGEQIRKHKFDQAGGKLLSFTSTPWGKSIHSLHRIEPVDSVAANQFYQDLCTKQTLKDTFDKEPDILLQDYKISYYYHNPLVNFLQCYYLVRSYAVLNAYFSRHLILSDKIYTRPASAPSWLGKKRKEQSILNLWEETYNVAPNKVLWDSTLALKRVSPTRKISVEHTATNQKYDNIISDFFKNDILTSARRHGWMLKNKETSILPYIHTFFNTMRWKGIEYKQVIAEMSRADLYSKEIANTFAKMYKIERLETEKHLKDLYDVANKTGNAKLYGLCINVMLFRPYLKNNPFKNVLATVNSIVDDDTSIGSNSISNRASPRQPTDNAATEDLLESFTRSSAASLLLELQEKRKKEKRRAHILENNTKALMFELKEGAAVDISDLVIPFDMRFDYKDLRPGRCYFCAGVFIEIPFLPPYKFEKDNDLEDDLRSFVDKQIDMCKAKKTTHAQTHSNEIEELTERAGRIVNESVTLFDLKFLYTMYPVLPTNFTELLLSKRIKRMDVNSDISDLSRLITHFKPEEYSLDMDSLDPHIQEQQWKSAMAESFCSLHTSEMEDYEISKSQVATEVIAKVTDLEIYLNNSMAKDLDQAESPLRALPSTKQMCQFGLLQDDQRCVGKSDVQPVSSPPTPLAESEINITELSPDNRMLPTNYRNVINIQTDHVFETNYKYYEHIKLQSTINNRSYSLGLMPIKSVIRDILFECLASLPPFARFIAKKLIEDGKVFRAEELQMLPFVLLQAQLLYRPARDLFIYLRHAMKKIYLLDIQKIQQQAADEEHLIPASSYKNNTAENDHDLIITNNTLRPNNSWRELMYRPCSQLFDFDGLWGDRNAAINSNKRLFNYCALLLYHTRLAAGRTRQLMIWKLKQIAKRDKGGFQKGDAFAEVASKYNNIATSNTAHNTLVEIARFSMFYEDTLNTFSGNVAIGRRLSPVIIYLRRISNHFICIYDDFCLESNKADECVANIRFSVLEEMRHEAQIHVYAILRIYGYKYMDDYLLGIQSNSLLLVYPLSLIVNLHTLYKLSSNSTGYSTTMNIKPSTLTNSGNQMECSSKLSESETLSTKATSSHNSTKNNYRFMILFFMMFVKHHANRMRPGYSFLIHVTAELYQDIIEADVSYCLYTLTLFELSLRMDNSYVIMWPHLTALLGSFNAEMLAEWLEITFKNIYITARNTAKKDAINYLQKQQTMISTLVSFVAHDQNTSCISNTSMCLKGELTVQESSKEENEDFITLILNTANTDAHISTGATAPQELIEGMRRISSPTHHERITRATDELLKMDRDQFVTDDMLERVQQRGKFATKIKSGNIDAIRADLDFRMNELNIILDKQEKSSNAADYEITEVREERQANEMGEKLIEYAISKQLTEKLRIIRRDLSPTSFRTEESMDLVTPMRDLREQCIKIESIKRQHELNELMRLSSTESPQIENNLPSIVKTAERTTHKLAQNVNDIRIRGSSMSAWRNHIKHLLQNDLQQHLDPQHTSDNNIIKGDHISHLKEDTYVREVDYTLRSDVQLPFRIQGTVKRILTPQPGKAGFLSAVKHPASTIPRRPYSILGNIQSSPGKSRGLKKCSPPPPGSTVFSSDIQE